MARDELTIVTDAWEPQINGVVTTYTHTISTLRSWGVDVEVINGEECVKKPLPKYPQIEVACDPWKIKTRLQSAIRNQRKIHIATEGPLGLYARLFVAKRNYPFTTCYHSKFPEFIESSVGIPARFCYPFFRWFHSRSRIVMVPNSTMVRELDYKGFRNLSIWSRGVDTDLFRPTKNVHPYIVCVTRVSREKNIEAFCEIKHPYKVVVGDGPYLQELRDKYPKIMFVGKKTGEELVRYYAEADVCVFPSYNDTFGVVMLESIACGTPVAAVPGPGQKEVINTHCGVVSTDLNHAVRECMKIDRRLVRQEAMKWTWETATRQFASHIDLKI
jgi:glycosyltransferase involved in cell wall biosynthesis